MGLQGQLLLTTTDFKTVTVLPNTRREKCKIVVCNGGLEDDYLSLVISDSGDFPTVIPLYQNFPVLQGDTYTSQFEISLINTTSIQAKSRRGLLSISIVN
jgi:hypothetical protein